jgi:hypothetical protein
MKLPADYVEFGGRATAPPPFRSTEGSFRGYLLEGDENAIAKLIDRMLTKPADGAVAYRPIFGKWVLMQTGAFKKVVSEAPGFEQWGHVEEAQISLWIPVEAGVVKDGEFDAQRICMAVPFILVNNPMSYAGGREIYGYPKTMGIFDPESATGDPQKVAAFGGDFAPENGAGWHPLFELRRTGNAAAAGQGEHFDDLKDALDRLRTGWEGLADGLPSLEILKSIFDMLLGKQARQVFLKQFRHESEAGQACYSTIIEAPIDFLTSHIHPAFEEWEIVIKHLDSHPVDVELGVETQTTSLVFDVEMDFIADKGEKVA